MTKVDTEVAHVSLSVKWKVSDLVLFGFDASSDSLGVFCKRLWFRFDEKSSEKNW
jgi:hypothetical protein